MLNELRITDSQKHRNRGNFVGVEGGAGARVSYKNFVREECKQCPIRAVRLFPLRFFLLLSRYAPGFARVSIVSLVKIRANSKHPVVPFARRPSLTTSRSSTFLSYELANPVAYRRQLHPRKSDRQFVSRSQSVLLNF